MLALLKLLLPALFPSWRFFDAVGPSPRIEFATAQNPAAWRAFRPKPQRLRAHEMLARLFWNPDANESLFLTSCAERLLETPTSHSENEIFARLRADLGPSDLQFRIVTLSDRRLVREVAYLSRINRA